jgi:hypothetical protein
MNALSTLIGLVLAISLASERLVAIIQTLLPNLLPIEKTLETEEKNLLASKWRQILLMLFTFVSCWATSTLLTENFDPFGSIVISSETKLKLPVVIMGLLSSGGSAFWNHLLGYTKEVKEIIMLTKAKKTLRFQQQLREHEISVKDDARTQTFRVLPFNSIAFKSALSNLKSMNQPLFTRIDQLINTNRI